MNTSTGSRTGLWMLMAWVKGVVEIDEREDGEHVGLEHGDQEIEHGQRYHQDKRHYCQSTDLGKCDNLCGARAMLAW